MQAEATSRAILLEQQCTTSIIFGHIIVYSYEIISLMVCKKSICSRIIFPTVLRLLYRKLNYTYALKVSNQYVKSYSIYAHNTTIKCSNTSPATNTSTTTTTTPESTYRHICQLLQHHQFH